MKPEQSPAHEASLIPLLLTGLVDRVCRRPRVVLVVALALAAVSAGFTWARLEYRTQRSDLDNPRKEHHARLREYLAEFGDDDDIVVVMKGADRKRMRQAIEALAAAVQQRPDSFDRLFFKVDLGHLHNRALLFLSADQIKQIQENLQSMSMLLEPPLIAPIDPLFGWKSLTLSRLLHEANERIARMPSDRPLTPADDQFFTQLVAVSRSAAAVLGKPAAYRTPWHTLLPEAPEQQDLLAEPQYFFSGDGSLAFLLVRPVKEQGTFTASQKSVAAMRAIIAAVGGNFPDLQFGLTGLPVLETDEMVASQRDTNRASWLALAGVGLLYFFVFRSFRYPLLTVATLLIGTAWAMGWLTLTVGHLNLLSATFVVMLIGMGDYGVLWVTRYQQNRAAGADLHTALRRTAAGGGPSILTAATATAMAFCAAMLADFQAVAELGWIAGCGVLLCALSCFTVLPALLMIFDNRPLAADPTERDGNFILSLENLKASTVERGWLPGLAARPRWVLGVSGLITVALACCACRVRYDHNLLHLQARDLEAVKWELTLIDHTAGASWHALSYTSTPEEALALKGRYEKLPGVSRVVEVASLIPREQPRKLDVLQDIQHRLRKLPRRGELIPHILPDVARVQTEVAHLAEALRSRNSPPVLAELHATLAGFSERLDSVPAPVCAERLRDYEQRMTGDLAEDLHRLRDVSAPAMITLADLPESLRVRYIGRSGKWLLRVFARECLWDNAPLKEFVRQIQTVDPEATGKPFSTLEGLQALREGFQRAGLYAFAAIVLVFLTDFRNLRRTLWALAPLCMGVVISLGIMGLTGLTLNPATIIAFPLILGVGAVYGVHVVHDYLVRRETNRGKPYTLSSLIGRAIMVMALMNMISFGTLAISSHRGLAGLGAILTLGVGCCMTTALVVLPAWLRVRSTRAKKSARPALPPDRSRRVA